MAKKGKNTAAPPASGSNSSPTTGTPSSLSSSSVTSKNHTGKQAFILNEEHFDAGDSVDLDEISTKQIEKAEAFRQGAFARFRY